MMQRVDRWLVLVFGALGCALPTAIGELPEAGAIATSSTTGPQTDGATMISDSATGLDTGDTEPVGPGPMRAFSLLFGELPDPGTDTASDVAGDSGTVDPDALHVVITTGPETCTDPYAALPCGGAWSIGFTLDLEHQTPGTYALFPDLQGVATETTADPVDCGFGGGTLDGMVEIDVVDAQHVAGRITGAPDLFDFDPNVEFDAPRCP
jgi:hypothetical protein